MKNNRVKVYRSSSSAGIADVLLARKLRGPGTAIIALGACVVFIWINRQVTAYLPATELWSPLLFRYDGGVNGCLSIDVMAATL